MTTTATLLLQAAEVLEKTAGYIEGAESSRLNIEHKSKIKTAQALADKLSATVGETVDPTLVEKISSLDPEMQELMGRLAVGGDVDSLGGVSDEVKVASDQAGINSADTRFLDWCNS